MERLTEYEVKILKALADPIRLQIINLLKDGERCVCEIIPTIGKAQSTTSKHLDILYGAGILNRRIEGKKTLYSVRDPQIFKLLEMLDRFILKQLSPVVEVVKTLRASKEAR